MHHLAFYSRRAARRPAKWNITPMLSAHAPSLRAALPAWSRPRHLRRAAACFRLAASLERQHRAAMQNALHQYGAHGGLVSGAGREHFPPDVKRRLRELAHAAAAYCSAGFTHVQAAGRRLATARRMRGAGAWSGRTYPMGGVAMAGAGGPQGRA